VRTTLPLETLTLPKSVWSAVDGVASPFAIEIPFPWILISGVEAVGVTVPFTTISFPVPSPGPPVPPDASALAYKRYVTGKLELDCVKVKVKV